MEKKYTCLLVDDEPIARSIIENYLSKIPSFEIVAQCKNATEALQILSSQSIDLLFLDINMPEISGLTLAKTIQSKTKIIFTTAYREYATEGFEVEALDYLVKPIAFDRFFKAIQKFLNSVETKKEDSKKETKDSFFVRSERKMIKISIPEILYVESLGDYVQIYTKDDKIITRESLTQIEKELPVNHFLRVHRSFIVAKAAVDSYTHEFLEIGKKAIPISRTYKEEVLKSFQ